jgi:hypothetical protein
MKKRQFIFVEPTTEKSCVSKGIVADTLSNTVLTKITPILVGKVLVSMSLGTSN